MELRGLKQSGALQDMLLINFQQGKRILSVKIVKIQKLHAKQATV
ncbi:MAG: hypothetical protein QG646_1258 [Euryarchaeota archaeon]|jgi:hypothetical protein|nr:hypothetical protein [Euryarchaeota archaeon]